MKNTLLLVITIIMSTMVVSCSSDGNDDDPTDDDCSGCPSGARTEYFTITARGTPTKAKIHLPPAYDTDDNLPAIFLIDFKEQHWPTIATDEFDKVIAGVLGIPDFEALVVSLDGTADIDDQIADFEEYFEIYKNMAAYVDEYYTNNEHRTFIGRGSEAGIILFSLFTKDQESSIFSNYIVTDPNGPWNQRTFQKINNNSVPNNLIGKKLHFSFSTTNDRDQCLTIINAIEEADYPWLEFEAIEYADIDFDNAYPRAFADGLKFVFSD